MNKKILIGCECSGEVRRAFRELGADAYSCDLSPSEDNSPYHIIDDVFNAIALQKWDLAIFHPPCTYLCSSGLHWNKKDPERQNKTNEALDFIRKLWAAPINKIAIENPVGCINTKLPFMPKPQYIQPYQFGEDASKKTGLWLKNLPILIPTKYIEPRIVGGKARWSNQTDSGQNRLGPSPERAAERAKTYPGIAKAMAEQWIKCL